MKYIEELLYGQIFYYNNEFYVLTNNFKTRQNKKYFLCISIKGGISIWLADNDMVEIYSIFYQDKESNLIEIKNETHQ